MKDDAREYLRWPLRRHPPLSPAQVDRLPDDVVAFFVAQIEAARAAGSDERRYISTVRGFSSDFYDAQPVEGLEELVQSIHETIAAYPSEGLASWRGDFDRWCGARAVKH